MQLNPPATLTLFAVYLEVAEAENAHRDATPSFALCITNRVLHNGVHTMMRFSLLSTSELTLGLSAPATRVITTRVYVSGIIGNYRPSGFSLDPRFVVTRLKSRCVTSVPGLPQFLVLASRRPVSLSLSAGQYGRFTCNASFFILSLFAQRTCNHAKS